MGSRNPAFMSSGSTSSFWFTFAIILLVIARFLFRELRVRRIKRSTIFSIPLVMAIVAGLTIYLSATTAPGQDYNLAIGGVIAIVVGIALGLAVGHFTTVQVQDGVMLVRGSWITVAIWVGALALRLLARFFVTGGSVMASTDPSTLGPSLMLNAVLVILLVAALFTVRLDRKSVV